MTLSIDISIYPPNRYSHEFTIRTYGIKTLETPADDETIKKLISQMHGIEYEILEQSIAIHGWILGPAKR